MIVEVSIVPLGVGPSLSAHVAEVVRLIRESGLKAQTHAMGTNIEGEWDEVMALIKTCHDRLLEMGAPRITSTMKVSLRQDKKGSIEQKLGSLEQHLKG
jgi:uncharacterized protein (TIGR00106 family)